MIAPVALVKPFPISPQRLVPEGILRPPYVGQDHPEQYFGEHVQSAETIAKMRIAGRIAAQALDVGEALLAPGVTTDEIDAAIHQFLVDNNAYPSTLGYRGFPKACCTSINEVICHGIPDARPLADGDLIKIDVTAYVDGVHGDNCATYGVGELDEDSRLLMERTKEAMERGIRAVRPGREISVIGRVIESYAKRFGYGVIRDYTGHGVHSAFHSGLVIPHYDNPLYNEVMEPGMTFTIEPMLAAGNYHSHVWDDGWTVVTNDASRVAQWESTLVVTDDGAEVLTVR